MDKSPAMSQTPPSPEPIRPPRTPAPTDAPLLAGLAEAALAAGVIIREIEARGITAEQKADRSPVTEADRAAEEVICAHLAKLLPDVPVVAEEAMSAGAKVEPGARFLLVDPLDGTREFLSGNGEYTVNIALVEDGTPVLGIVYAPALALLFAGRPGGAFRALRAPGAMADAQDWEPISCRPVPEGPIVVATSRSHGDPKTDAYVAQFPVAELIPAGSALKFGLLAEGKVDLYPRFGTVMEWDSAAGHALVKAAGGSVTRLDGSPLTYGHPDRDFKVNGFLAWGPGGPSGSSARG